MDESVNFIVDMDGVIYRDGDPLEGAIKLSNFLNNNYKLTFLTNNSSKTPNDYMKKLSTLGIDISEEQIMTSGKATALYLKNDLNTENKNCYVIGGSGLIEQVQEIGWNVLSLDEFKNSWKNVSAVIVGWDKHFTFDKMKYATLAIRNGSKFIGTNPDNTYPSKEGIIPGAGAIISSIQTPSEVTPTIIGKPNSWMFREMDLNKNEKTIIIGDRLDTDIKFGKNVGISTALVLSGISNDKDLKDIDDEDKPDYVFNNAKDIYDKIKSDEFKFKF